MKKSASGPQLEKTYASIIKDPENQLLTITIPLIFEAPDSDGSDHVSTEARPLDTLVDFIQTFVNPKKKPESGLWSKDQIPCPFQCQCKSEEESAEIKAESETASPETEPLKLTPVQEFRLKTIHQIMDRYPDTMPDKLLYAAVKLADWVLSGEAKS